MSITAVVINFNAGKALHRCVAALVGSAVRPSILVVDNASSDGSAEQLRRLYGNQAGIEIRINPSNIGYAPAVNVAVKASTSELVLIINPDCVIGNKALGLMSAELEKNQLAALAAPYVIGSDGKFEKASLRRFPDPWNSLMTMTGLWRLGQWLPLFRGVPFNPQKLPVETITADAVSGACMLIRRNVLMDIGLLDEGYGLHCEDLDLMFRLKLAGWHCLFVPAASATHEQGVSSRSRPFWVHRQKHLGMARFFRKFQAQSHWLPVRWLVYSGIWARYLLMWPLVWLRK